MKNLGLIFSAIIISTTSFAQTNNEIKRPPEWFVKHMEEMVGTWITDNKDYKNETEVWDAYGMEWKYGIGKMSLSGVLFGLKEGKRMADFWEFKTYWNPADGKFMHNNLVAMAPMVLVKWKIRLEKSKSISSLMSAR